MEIEVAYDMHRLEWFTNVNGRIVHAKTIRDLLQKLGPGFTVYGYHPDGFNPPEKEKEVKTHSERTLKIGAKIAAGESIRREDITNQPLPAPRLKGKDEESKRHRNADGNPTWTEEEWEQAKELRAAKYTVQQIADMLGKSYNSIVGKFDRERERERRQSEET